MGEPIAVSLARWVVSFEAEDLAPRERLLARARLLDTVGLAAAGMRAPSIAAVWRWTAGQSTGVGSVLLGTGLRVSPALAAFAHGAAAHVLDFDDTLPASVVHPGSIVVPVALAVGEAWRRDSAEVLAAIAIGYEVAARIGAAFGTPLHTRGFHPSGVVGPLAAAATAARLLGLDAQQTAQALGLAASTAGGLMTFLVDGSGSKAFHCGWAAHAGITTAQLAAAGFPGPTSVLDGPVNLFDAFGRSSNSTDLTAALGRDWQGSTAEFKYFPGAHVIHPFIAAALALRADGVTAASVRRICCTVPRWGFGVVCEPRAAKLAPRSSADVIASLPYLVAAAFVDGACTPATLEPTAFARPEALVLASKIECVPDDAAARFGGTLQVELQNGSRRTLDVALPRFDEPRLRGKFRANVGADRLLQLERLLDAAIIDLSAIFECLGRERTVSSPTTRSASIGVQ